MGKPRSGKGTLARVLKGLVGEDNTIGFALDSLDNEFGLEDLIDKQVAIVGDARLDGKSHKAVTRLLSISGEDKITINRKHEKKWHGTLGVAPPPSWAPALGSLNGPSPGRTGTGEMRRKPTLSGALRRFRAPVLLSVVMRLDRCRFAVATELFISDNLFGVEQGTDLQMRGQMHRPQAALKLSNGRSLSRDTVGRDFTCCKKLIERPFTRDHIVAA